ncbi:MAG: hypothetical protein WAZ19_12650 [Anaerolineae bacterium]
MKALRLLLLLALVAVALVFVLRDLDPDVRQARAAREWARAEEARADAAAAQAWSESWAEYADLRAAALTWGLVGAVSVSLAAGFGAVIGITLRTVARRRHIYPNSAGQFPVLQIGGADWQALVDPNRAPGHVTLIGNATTPTVATPLPLSEGGHVTLAQQASAVAAVTAASQATGGTSRPRLDMATIMQPPSYPAPLPEVVDVDPTHVDRLLQITHADSEVIT